MSAHPAPRATRSIRPETAGSSELALGPNQHGKAGGEVETSIPVMAMAHQRTRRRARPANPSSSTRVDRATHVILNWAAASALGSLASALHVSVHDQGAQRLTPALRIRLTIDCPHLDLFVD